MKTSKANIWKTAGTSLFAAAVSFSAVADQTAPAPGPEKCYQGTVVSTDANEHMLRVKGGWFMPNKSFNLGDNCVYVEPGRDNLPVSTVRPGEKVSVSYQDRHGVLIADRVAEIPLRIEGTVTAIDVPHHVLAINQTGSNKQLWLPDDCRVRLHDGKTGMLNDIQVGSYVTVTYETPNNTLTARQIAQTSLEFSGTLTAIDLDNRTVKAKATFASKRFSLADNCAIVINGKPDGRLADLKPEDNLVFSYDEVNGVNIVNRIAPEPAPENHVAGTTPVYGY